VKLNKVFKKNEINSETIAKADLSEALSIPKNIVNMNRELDTISLPISRKDLAIMSTKDKVLYKILKSMKICFLFNLKKQKKLLRITKRKNSSKILLMALKKIQIKIKN
jgi:hypothetical protein